MRLDQALQAFGQDVGVDLCGGDVGMAQKELQTAQVGAAGEHVAREGVPQDVGADTFGVDAGVERDLFEDDGEALAGDGLAAAACEEPKVGLGAGGKHGGDGVARGVREGDEAFLAAFAFDHQQRGITGKRHAGKGKEFGDSQACCIEHFERGGDEQCPCCGTGTGGGEQGVDLILGQVFGQRPGEFGGIEEEGGVIGADLFGDEEAVELADGREFAGGGAGGEALGGEVGEPGAGGLRVGFSHCVALARHECGKIGEVGFIGVESVAGCVALGSQHFQEGLDVAVHCEGSPDVAQGFGANRSLGRTFWMVCVFGSGGKAPRARKPPPRPRTRSASTIQTILRI